MFGQWVNGGIFVLHGAYSSLDGRHAHFRLSRKKRNAITGGHQVFDRFPARRAIWHYYDTSAWRARWVAEPYEFTAKNLPVVDCPWCGEPNHLTPPNPPC
jgi:hypothetical protein